MPERAVFLDRDNTLIENDGYLGDPAKVKLLPGAASALVALRGLGYRLIVVSNQSGVARGMFGEADVEAVNNEVSRQLREKAGAYIDASYYCPYHPEAPLPEFRADHDWRKPKPGMLLQAAADFGLDLKQSWMVGDQGRDVAAGAAAGCRTILLRDADVKAANGAEEDFAATPHYVVRTLADAARIIAREKGGTHPPAEPPTVEAPPPEEDEPAPAPVAPAVAEEPVAEESPVAEEPVAAAAEEPAVAVQSQTPPAPAPKPRPATPPAHEKQIESALVPSPAAPATNMSQLERHLDELVMQMRQQTRNEFLRPDFSFSNMAALILQVFAIVALIIGMAKYFTSPATFTTPQDTQFALMSHMAALFWVMAAVFMQGVVGSLLLYSRHKHGT